jgi:DNA topoisomerase-1
VLFRSQDPETGLPVIARAGRFGPYVQLGEATDGKQKPKTASLFKTMSLETVTLEQALELLQLPRVLGVDPADGQEVTAQNGRFGPYVKKGSETRSLDDEQRLLTVTLEEALELLAQPKRRGGPRVAAGPLRELGEDPASGMPVVLREGRFGPYVTDGTVNASLRKGDDVETITLERAAELLADRRARGDAPRKAVRRSGAAKAGGTAPAKKAAARRAGTAKRTGAAKKAKSKD